MQVNKQQYKVFQKKRKQGFHQVLYMRASKDPGGRGPLATDNRPTISQEHDSSPESAESETLEYHLIFYHIEDIFRIQFLSQFTLNCGCGSPGPPYLPLQAKVRPHCSLQFLFPATCASSFPCQLFPENAQDHVSTRDPGPGCPEPADNQEFAET